MASRRIAVGLAVLLAAGVLPAEPPRASGETLILSPQRMPLVRASAGEPWLGISVHKPTNSIRGALHGIPEGVGFVIQDVVVDGPAAAAGIQKFDFLWKLDDQLVVNEAQFLVLLHLRKVGEPVKLTVQRAGQDHEITVTLGHRPSHTKGRKEADVLILSDPPIPGMSKRMVESLRQEASIKTEEGTQVRLRRKGKGFHWEHLAQDGRVIQEGDMDGAHDLRFPAGSNRGLSSKLRALIRVFEDAEKRARSNGRPPRIRQAPRSGANKVPNP